jgi:hypothetical protein
MAVPAVNITIEQGADFASSFTITNSDGSAYNLLNSSAAAKLKKFSGSGTSYSFSTSITVNTGKISLTMANSVTSTIPAGRYYYDILLTNNNTGIKTRVIEGMAFVSAAIS